jgi:NAD(P)-dependent dehydrogenase (short-subunit alcohol dehydrogenase family)
MGEREEVVVIGGGSGIGEATAILFARRGASVFIIGRDRNKLEAVATRIGAVSYEAADAKDGARLQSFFAKRGEFQYLVLCLSGGKGGGPFRTLALDDLRSGLEGKLLAQLSALQAALPFVTQSVTFVSAASARAALPGTAGLAAINGAIESIVRTLATELAPVRVNAVSPGIIDTPWWNAMPAQTRTSTFEQVAKTLPTGRVGKPEDVASAIVWVATDSYVTGTVVDVSGGAALPR